MSTLTFMFSCVENGMTWKKPQCDGLSGRCYQYLSIFFEVFMLSFWRWQFPQLPRYEICHCRKKARDHKGHYLRCDNEKVRWGIYRWYTELLSEKMQNAFLQKHLHFRPLFKQTELGCWQPRRKDPWRVDDEGPNNLETNIRNAATHMASWVAAQNGFAFFPPFSVRDRLHELRAPEGRVDPCPREMHEYTEYLYVLSSHVISMFKICTVNRSI